MLTEIKLVQNTPCSLQCWYRTSLVFIRKRNAKRNQTGIKIHTAPYYAGIEPVWYSEEKKMLTGIKLVQNTHCSLQCWYRTSLVSTRKTNPNKNQTGTKINTHFCLPCSYRRSLVFRRKTNAKRNQTGTIYTPLLIMLV